MRLVQLGQNGPRVAAIGQGTMGHGGNFSRDEVNDAESERIIRLGVHLGMTLIDTAEVYGDGHSEELVGRAVAHDRHAVVIATKFSAEHSRAGEIVTAAEGSLRRLATDYIDIYQPHWPNPKVPFEETLEAMDRLVQAGKVRMLGLSNFDLGAARRAKALLQHGAIVALQHEYNLMERTVEAEVLPYCQRENVALMAYGPFQQGKLVSRSPLTEPLFKMAERYAISVPELVLSWLVSNPGVIAIPKASREEKLRANARVLTLKIAPDDRDALSEIFRVPVVMIATDQIDPIDADDGRSVYRTIDDAVKNTLNMSPSPLELSQEIQALGGKLQKPIKLRRNMNTGRYSLVEGRLKYWGWLIAYGVSRPIPALIENETTADNSISPN